VLRSSCHVCNPFRCIDVSNHFCHQSYLGYVDSILTVHMALRLYAVVRRPAPQLEPAAASVKAVLWLRSYGLTPLHALSLPVTRQ